MGALLAKPIASTTRLWDLTFYNTVDYLDNFSNTRLTIYLFAGKAVKILPFNSWISDKARFSFDGWYRQRLSFCYLKGLKISWFKACAVFSNLIINKKVALHWSSIESSSVTPFLYLISKIGLLSLPFTDTTKNVTKVKNDLNRANSFRWSFFEEYPTYFSEVKPFLYRSKSNLSLTPPFLQKILTSTEETELSLVSGSLTTSSNVNCYIQSEALTSKSDFVYFGTHGNANAPQSFLNLPILLAYERSNPVTGPYFIKGPKFARSLTPFSFTLLQILYNFFNFKGEKFLLSKPYKIYTFIVDKLLNFTLSFSKFLALLRQPPQYEVSPLVQILTNFIRYE